MLQTKYRKKESKGKDKNMYFCVGIVKEIQLGCEVRMASESKAAICLLPFQAFTEL